MDVYQFAMQMELDGEKFYRESADQIRQPAFKVILNMLADDERKHYVFVERMMREKPIFHETIVLHKARNIFKDMKKKKEKILEADKQKKIYLEAEGIESMSEEFYCKKSEETTDPGEKTQFMKLAREEKKHLILLQNLVEYITQPDTWVESAEFHHNTEY